MVNSNAKSEFGGGRGRIAPAPHDPNDINSDIARLMRMTDSTDASDSVDAALIRERAMEKRTGDTPS